MIISIHFISDWFEKFNVCVCVCVCVCVGRTPRDHGFHLYYKMKVYVRLYAYTMYTNTTEKGVACYARTIQQLSCRVRPILLSLRYLLWYTFWHDWLTIVSNCKFSMLIWLTERIARLGQPEKELSRGLILS